MIINYNYYKVVIASATDTFYQIYQLYDLLVLMWEKFSKTKIMFLWLNYNLITMNKIKIDFLINYPWCLKFCKCQNVDHLAAACCGPGAAVLAMTVNTINKALLLDIKCHSCDSYCQDTVYDYACNNIQTINVRHQYKSTQKLKSFILFTNFGLQNWHQHSQATQQQNIKHL